MSKFRLRILTAAFLLLACISTMTAQEQDALRIVSLGSSVTQQLYLLGIGEQIVGNTTYCNIPEDARNKEKVGSIRTINVEKVLSLKPDIVFTTGMTSLKQVQLLKKLGLNIVQVLTPNNFDAICNNFIQLGKITGRQKEAQVIVNSCRKQINVLRSSLKINKSPKVFFQIGIKPIFTVSSSYYLNDLITLAGGINIAADESDGIYSREKVISENPDIIIITTMGLQGDKERAQWLKFTEISAVRNNYIHVVPSAKMCNPNPISFVENLQVMIAIMNQSQTIEQ